MNPDPDAQTRQFLERLIDRRQRDTPQLDRRSSVYQRLLEQEQHLNRQIEGIHIQQRNNIQNFLMSRQAMNSPIAEIPMVGDERLRCETTRFQKQSMESMDMMNWQGGQNLRLRRCNGTAGFVSPFSTSLKGKGATSGVAEQIVNKWHPGGFKLQPFMPVSPSLSAAMAQYSSSNQQLSLLNGRRKPHFPRIKKSHFFLPLLPSTKKRSTSRKFKARMKSYKALWHSNTTVLVSTEARTEIFSRAVSRGRVKIRDQSRTLASATLPCRKWMSGFRVHV